MAKRKKREGQQKKGPGKRPNVGYVIGLEQFDEFCCDGYIRLDRCPEVVTAFRKIAVLISSMTIHLMCNTDNGDVRLKNELARKIDIEPYRYMTRRSWMEYIVMNMLLYGMGNSVVRPHMEKGMNGEWILGDLEPIPPGRVSFIEYGRGYKVLIDGKEYDPDEVLHFVENPDKWLPWWGRGATVLLKDVADNLKQASRTEKGFWNRGLCLL